MQFADRIHTSTIDYPGHLSCIIYTLRCNLDCSFCHNKQLVYGEVDKISASEMIARLQKRRSFVDHLVITGGEPTINVALDDFCQKIKNLGFKIKLDTNGLRPKMLQKLVEGHLVDYVAMDLKSSLDRYGRFLDTRLTNLGVSYEHLNFLMSSIRVLRDSDIVHEYRTTPTKLTCQMEDFDNISRMLRMMYENSERLYKPAWYIQYTRQIEDGTLDLYTEEELKIIVDHLKDSGSFVNIQYR